MRLIQTTDLSTWAKKLTAKSSFPYFVRRLICASINPSHLDMPFGDSVWLPGFDGYLVSADHHAYVPQGNSVWEVGTDSNYRSKAQSDYDKRSLADPETEVVSEPIPGLNKIEATFVFVTPHVWKNKRKWVAERQAEGVWKDVMVIDGAMIVQWLEQAPAVALSWASEMRLIPNQGLLTLEQAWQSWSLLTDPASTEELVTVGRSQQERDLLARIAAEPNTFVVKGSSQREAWGFAIASLRRVLNEVDRIKVEARTLVADTTDVLASLSHLSNHLVVVRHAGQQVSGDLSFRNGCHVIVPEGNEAPEGRNAIILDRPTRQQFSRALENMGFSGDNSERAARACGSSVTVFQRLYPRANVQVPSWCEHANIHYLLCAVLVGRWDGSNTEDRRVLCGLTGVLNYDELEAMLTVFLTVEEPPIRRIGDMWVLSAPVDVFQLLARRFTPGLLSKYRDVFRSVFGRIDPKVELTPEQWIRAQAKGSSGCSNWMRKGMAETLLLISERGRDAGLPIAESPKRYAESLAQGIPGLTDWRILASLRDEYSQLLEAAPGPFLDSLEFIANSEPDSIRQLFTDRGGLFGQPLHTGLLWGLEALAWSSLYFGRVTHLLAKLSSLDPGGRYLNRPINSLRAILGWRIAGTGASFDMKLAAIDRVVETAPAVGWNLIETLLPNPGPAFVTSTTKPVWREIEENEGDVSESARRQYTSRITDKALSLVGSEPTRWQAILRVLPAMSSRQIDRALLLLHTISLAPEANGSQTKQRLWSVLREYVVDQQSLDVSDRLMPSDVLSGLSVALKELEPEDLVASRKWLFDEWFPTGFGTVDIEQAKLEADRLRIAAIGEIADRFGVEGIARLGSKCQLPGIVAELSVQHYGGVTSVSSLVDHALHTGEGGVEFAGLVSGQALRLFGREWVEHFRVHFNVGESLSPHTVASLLHRWPDSLETWQLAQENGVEDEYWRFVPVHLLAVSPADVVYQIERLVWADRAIEVLNIVGHRPYSVPTRQLVSLFDSAAQQSHQGNSKNSGTQRRVGPSALTALFKELRSRTDISSVELAEMEYRALPVWGFNLPSDLTLLSLIPEDPLYFVDLVCDAYLPAHRDKTVQTDPSPEEIDRANAAHHLLRARIRIPGQSEDGVVDEGTLSSWINNARADALERDRAQMTDMHIGYMLAHSLGDKGDGAWPQRSIRGVIEKVGSRDIERGIELERFNMRGVVTKRPLEGGGSERALAKEYLAWAKLINTTWSRTGDMLRRIAQAWIDTAKREDDEADQDRLED